MEQKQQKEMSRNYLKIRTDFQLRMFLGNSQFQNIATSKATQFDNITIRISLLGYCPKF